MRWNQLFDGIAHRILSTSQPVDVSDVWSDSRKTGDKSAFVCIKGSVNDGLDYLPDAWNRGCRLFIVDRRSCVRKLLEISPDALKTSCVVLVTDCRKAYSQLCRNFYNKPDEGMNIIGITGTKGKTTIAGLIRQIAGMCGINCGSVGTLGAFWLDKAENISGTTPDAKELFYVLSEMKRDGVSLVVMEVSSQGLKQKRVWPISFAVGVFTNLYPDHISEIEHKDMDEYFYWKSSLFEHCRKAVILDPQESPYAEELVQKIGYSIPVYFVRSRYNKDCLPEQAFPVVMTRPVQLLRTRNRPCQRVYYRINDHSESVCCMHMPGRFYVENFLFSVTVMYALGIKVNPLLNLKPVDGRMECVCVGKGVCFFVDYAHNPRALKESIESLKEYNPDRLICVFGCGGNRSVLRRYGMGRVSASLCDLTIITEDNSRFESFDDICADIVSGMEEKHRDVEIIPDRDMAIRRAVEISKPGDIVIIAGKGHETYMDKNGVKTYFSDKKEVIKYVKVCKYNN